MPAAISDIRAGLADALGTISGLRIHDVLPDNPNPPAATISLDRVTYDSVLARGADMYEFTITVLVSRADDRTAQTRLEQYIAGNGTTSIKQAVENDPTLGGIAQVARVSEARNLATIDRADGTSYLIVEFGLLIHA